MAYIPYRGFPAFVVAVLLALVPCIVNAEERIWVLPFENPSDDAATKYLEEMLPGLLSAVISEATAHALVDRENLSRVLAEHSLTLRGLRLPADGQRVGRLLGATLVISGSFVPRGDDLLVSVRAFDVQTAVVNASAEISRSLDEIDEIVRDIYRQLADGLDRRLSVVPGGQLDTMPMSNLHFMRGLAHYHNGKSNQAVASFTQASREPKMNAVAGLWIAKSYLVRGHYDHAYIELLERRSESAPSAVIDEIGEKIRVCEEHLAAADAEMIRRLVAADAETAP